MPPQSMQEKNAISMERRKQAYDLLKELAQKCGIMQHGRDGHGYDEMIGMLESGEFQLEINSSIAVSHKDISVTRGELFGDIYQCPDCSQETIVNGFEFCGRFNYCGNCGKKIEWIEQ